MDYTSLDLSVYNFDIRRSCDTPKRSRYVSIVICTYGRDDSLAETLNSLSMQSFKNFEVILVTGKGPLAQLRQEGLTASQGKITTFIDDDVFCPKDWLRSIVKVLNSERIVGVSGPTFVPPNLRRNRDAVRGGLVHNLYEKFFVNTVRLSPGHLSDCGAPSMASNYGHCHYVGPVQYLECCNMSVRTKEALQVGGFDSSYGGVGEWSEVELSFKLGKLGTLWFEPSCGLVHNVSRSGAYKNRSAWHSRYKNLCLFQKRWVKDWWKSKLYRRFFWIYLRLKLI